MARADRPGVRALPRRGAAARRSTIGSSCDDAAGDHLGRRPGAAGRRQPALERVPRDARRRAHHARARAAERHRARRGRGLGAGDLRRGAERLFRPFVSNSAAAPASGLRSRRSSRPRSAGGSSSSPSVGKGSRFELVLPADARRQALSRQLVRRSVSRGLHGRLDAGRAVRSWPRQPSVSSSTSRAEVVDARVPLRVDRAPRAARAGESRCSRGPSPRRGGARSGRPPRAGRHGALHGSLPCWAKLPSAPDGGPRARLRPAARS